MELKIYRSYDEKKENTPLFISGEFLINSANENVINNIIESFKSGETTIFLDDHRYESKDLSFSQINIKNVCRLCFAFIGNNDKEKIISEVSNLKKMPIETEEEQNDKVKAVFQIIRQFSPIFAISDKSFAFINEEFANNLLILQKSLVEEIEMDVPEVAPVLEAAPVMEEKETIDEEKELPVEEIKENKIEKVENEPKDKVPFTQKIKNFFAKFKIKRKEQAETEVINKPKKTTSERKNFLIDVFYVISMPALMLVFLFIVIDFFNKDKVGLGIFIVIVLVIETGIFGYGLYLINCEEQNHRFLNKSKLILYAINLAGLFIGFGLALLVGATVLKISDFNNIISIAFICLESTFIVSILLHIFALLASELMEKRKAKKRLGKKK